ncbi:DNA-J related domain-containing protein [Neptunomonas antarctica]|uniref:DnaJ domain-containing protein n=1 Tax=Neptunomonas antarctica TaxID=619304 RepID=A0A1N7KXJ1_9GAMM|nr:DNA-J related domain-containing protein [Neptunomonas antarctica]SIS66305.1 DnaJ domain-containing protein [Neptunomonas antarctica]
MHNPIIAIALATLRKHPTGFDEYTLIKAAEFAGIFDAINSPPELALFQKHFLTMNALYQLQASFWEDEQLYLSISAMHIYLESHLETHLETQHINAADFISSDTTTQTLPQQSRNEALSSYYLDWSQYDNADEASVSQLLNSFWERFLNPQQYNEALAVLEISEQSPDKITIKRQFRQLAAQHHPDKGGDPDTFIAIREAYELLT